MSAQLLELLFFAGIAFLVISKLISTLGMTSDDDVTKKNSYFGENSLLKDVTNSATNTEVTKPDFFKKKAIDINELEDLIVGDNKQAIIQGLNELGSRIASFTPDKFLRNAKSAFKMIIDSGITEDQTMIKELVDKRYVPLFAEIISSYGNIVNIDNLEAKISDIYMFGNNAFIKVLFNGSKITDNLATLYEEWTFSKNLNTANNNWYLSNIERMQ